jgi:hypothetical protein
MTGADLMEGDFAANTERNRSGAQRGTAECPHVDGARGRHRPLRRQPPGRDNREPYRLRQSGPWSGCDLRRATEAILSVVPLDTFVDAAVSRMKVVDDPGKVLPIFAEIGAIADRIEGRKVTMGALDRFKFCAAAKRAYAIVRTSDPGPYGCFIFRKGVI